MGTIDQRRGAPPAPPLPSRLAPPRPSGLVTRARLLDRVRTADTPLVVVHAPAGYGKTSLLSQLADDERRPVARLALQERDDDPVVFLHELVHAIGGVAAPDPDLLGVLATLEPGTLPRALAALASWLGEGTGPFVLVLDDVHALRSPGALGVLQALCACVPVESRLLLGSRARPSLPIARLRAAGRLLELTAADLRMTHGEGVAMLAAAGARLDPAEAALVVDRTEGWPAAIYLASLILRDPGSAVVSLTPAAGDTELAEYVRDEVLALVEPDDAEFLLQCSILDRLDPAFCDAVLGRADAAARLRSLAQARFFVATVDGRADVYRMHSLFRSLLHAELRSANPALEQELQRRACAAYRDAGDTERALEHAAQAGDLAGAAALMWEAAVPLVSQGRSATLRRWSARFGDDLLAAHPEAALARGWAAMLDGDAALGAHCAAIACGADPAARTTAGDGVQALGLLLRACLAPEGPVQAVRDAAAADAGLRPDNPLRGAGQLITGSLRMLDGDLDAGRAALVAAEQCTAGQLTTVYALALAQQAVLAMEDERWDRAGLLADRIWSLQHRSGVRDYPTQAPVVAVHALTLAHSGDASRAREEADVATRTLAMLEPVIPWLALETRLVLARTRAALGDGRQARQLLRKSRDAMGDDTSRLLRTWAARLARTLDELGATDADGPALTTAELRILQFLPTHMSLAAIGEHLHLSRNTVKTHVAAIYRKLGVASRADAVARGRELGLLDAEPTVTPFG